MNIIIRCDSSWAIGSGHVVRCRTLGLQLKNCGVNVVFVCKRLDGALISYLEDDFRVLTLVEQSNSSLVDSRNSRTTDDDEVADWLGWSESRDAQETLAALDKHTDKDWDWVIVDNYALGVEWEAQVASSLQSKLFGKPKIFVIDDLANRCHCADMLLDQNFHGNHSYYRYKDLISASSLGLYGPHYALLQEEYGNIRKHSRTTSGFRRIFVYFGGSDVYGLTLKTLRALTKPFAQSMIVDVVIDTQHRDYQQIRHLAGLRENTYIHSGLKSLSGIMSRADFAIGACGTTTWERVAIGLKSLVWTIADNQVASAEELSRHGYIMLAGKASETSEGRMAEIIHDYLKSEETLRDGKELTDGLGTRRVVTALLNRETDVSLRPVSPEDEALLFRWANDPCVRNNSFSVNEISYSQHQRWFQDSLRNVSRLHFIAYTSDSLPVGQIRFDLNNQKETALIDISIDRCARGRGLASLMIKKGVSETKRVWRRRLTLVGYVRRDNHASNSSFKRAGFLSKSTCFNEVEVIQWSKQVNALESAYPVA